MSFRTDYCTLPKNGNIFGTPILQSFLVKTNLSINLLNLVNFLPIVTSFTKMPKNKAQRVIGGTMTLKVYQN